MLSDIIVWAVIIGFAVLLFVGIIGGWLSDHNNNFAAVTFFHDVQPKDKQEAIEVVIEQKAGKKQFEQTNSERLFSDGRFEIRNESEINEGNNEL